LTTTFLGKQLLVAEGTVVNTLVTRQAIVVALMKAALDTKQIAGGTLRPAKLDASMEVHDCTVERSIQLFHARVLGLETLCVRFQPLIDMVNA
jgi:hypothetical protein